MQNVNYIQHLLAVFKHFYKDSRLNPQHISLYMALFQYWNLSRFRAKFYISRQDIMEMAKVGSTATYHKCIKNLHSWGYLNYYPSKNPFKGSQVKMFIFETSLNQELNKSQTSFEQDLIPNTNIKKTNKNILKRGAPPSKKEVIDFFKKKKWPAIEGEKFYLHYQSTGWVLRDNHKIKDWNALAEKWMLREIENQAQRKISQYPKDYLHTPKDKNYAEPL